MTFAFTTRRGSVIHVEESGAGRPVLAIHGLGGGAYFFQGMASQMGDRHRVFAVDLPGTGRSTAAGPYSLDSWVADLGDLVETHIGAPVAIVGHSMGTIVALKAWAAWPHRIRGLVFVGGLPRVRDAVRLRLEARAKAIAADGMRGWGPNVSPGIFSPSTFIARPEVIGLFERLFETHPPESYLRSLEILLGADARAEVGLVHAPTLAITGHDDQYAPPPDVEAFMAAMTAPHRVAIIPDAGHMPFFEQPAGLAGLVGEFLDQIN